MKIAVSNTGTDSGEKLDGHFGRCAQFTIVDTETCDRTAVPNPGHTAQASAGVVAAKAVADAGADTVVTGWLGPHALSLLKRRDIRVLKFPQGSVDDMVTAVVAGGCEEVQAADTSLNLNSRRQNRESEVQTEIETARSDLPQPAPGKGMALRGGGAGRGGRGLGWRGNRSR
jgi:predicted Fe-Mo cluster-binding NifX family protein